MPLSALQPQALWQHFQTLCDTPRPSKHESALINKIRQWADAHGIENFLDQTGNLILRKAASAGCEKSVPVVMQSHLDMVAQKRSHSAHDFFKDPIQPRIDNNWVYATDTTLGADNGIGVAAILAVFGASDIQHGPLEALLTVDEEAGMSGAKGLQPGILNAQVLLNLDTEEEGELYVGCAGGVDVCARFDLQFSPVPANATGLQINVSGLKGGHSGIDIHKPLANANQLLARLLDVALQQGAQLAQLQGGTLRNAISRDASATLCISQNQMDDLNKALQAEFQKIQAEYGSTEKTLNLQIENATQPAQVILPQQAQQIIAALLACPHGVRRWSDQFEGVVETSNNLGVIRQQGNQLEIYNLTRSLLDIGRDAQVQAIRHLFTLAGARVTESNAYPGWAPVRESPLMDLMQQVHQQCFGHLAKVQIIHAGLECGILGAAYPHWQMISFGPCVRGAHSPDEGVSISSVQQFWLYLCAALKALSERKAL